MKRTQRVALALILLSIGISVLWGSFQAHSSFSGMTDFKAVYYGARCLIQHGDPYQADQFMRVYLESEWETQFEHVMSGPLHDAISLCVNLPTTLFLVAPFALLPWGPACWLWTALVAAGLTLAAFLMWKLAASHSSGVSLFLVCILLANCFIIFAYGNAAGLVVSLCVVAVWCFLQERFVPAGILCLAVSLAIKPHDAGLVWLYFLLAGGTYRKRALQTLAVTIVLGLPALLWVSSVAPHWMPELQSNILATSARGALNDPGPASIDFLGPDPIVDLQSVISVLRDDPHIYNPAGYLLSGVLLLAWSLATLRSRVSPANTWLALAAIATLTMLVTYHREHDAKLLLLTVPACAMLWAEGGPMGWFALLANSAGILITGDIPSMLLLLFTRNLPLSTAGLFGKIETILLVRPASLILLAMSIFYLWAYVRRAFPNQLPGSPV
jgi:hypothetical protein